MCAIQLRKVPSVISIVAPANPTPCAVSVSGGPISLEQYRRAQEICACLSDRKHPSRRQTSSACSAFLFMLEY